VEAPLISFISPNFNRAEFIRATMDSLLVQTDPRWENVIVDDGSTDDSVAIIESYVAKDPRIRFFRRDREPKGACPCRNIGVEEARGKYLVFLDTDDLAAPHCAEQRIRVMEANPALQFAIFQAIVFNNEPWDLGLLWNIDKPSVDDLSRQLQHDAVCQGTGPVFRISAFKEAGGWSEQLAIWQDIELFVRLYASDQNYRKYLHYKPDIFIRQNPASISRTNLLSQSKTESRMAAMRSIVAILKQQNKHHYLKDARFIGIDTVSSVIRCNSRIAAHSFINWIVKEIPVEPYLRLRIILGQLLRIVGLMKYSRVALAWGRLMVLSPDSENMSGKIQCHRKGTE
jgi:glycosyltransferase involved in cell wall biosynthesis